MSEKQIETIIVEYKQFSDYDFIPPGAFYIRIATGDYVFYKTSDRAKAQAQIDLDFPPKGKYTAIPSKISKGKSKREDGGYSAVGVGTRKGQKKYN